MTNGSGAKNCPWPITNLHMVATMWGLDLSSRIALRLVHSPVASKLWNERNPNRRLGQSDKAFKWHERWH
eukprot:1271133-Amphidinium_carterae.1